MAQTYVIDTSALIDMDYVYPKLRFPKVWEKFDRLVGAKRVLAPAQVFNEIIKSEFLLEWREVNKAMFLKITTEVRDSALKITEKFPTLTKKDRVMQQADPFVIALAISLRSSIIQDKPVIITQENKTERNKIPYVAKSFGVESERVMGMFDREEWVF